MSDTQLLSPLRTIMRRAGDAILHHYGSPIPVEYKGDNSPLTEADRASHRIIKDALEDLTPDIPILSEESEEQTIRDRHEWDRFWLVDPLDGTKEFIKESGEFTVNIALIDGNAPTLGVIHVPARDLTYFAAAEHGAYRQEGEDDPETIHTRSVDEENLVVVASRDHAGDALDTFLSNLPDVRLESMGSSLKFCWVAAGHADVYFRDIPTMEWDTGAAQCIVETAGGLVSDFHGHRLTYNKDSLRNPSLMTVGDPSWAWQSYMP
jgi:3'(2'), 5'-bisphosphate nucleotidase